jgi:hypothetical protein
MNIHGTQTTKQNKTKQNKTKPRNITAKTTLKYGCECWIFTKRDMERLEALQTVFLPSLLGVARLDHQRNMDTKIKLNGSYIISETEDYKKNWL